MKPLELTGQEILDLKYALSRYLGKTVVDETVVAIANAVATGDQPFVEAETTRLVKYVASLKSIDTKLQDLVTDYFKETCK